MSLFGSLQVASNTLQAMQVGLQVVNNNIANANTDGYIREQTNYVPAPVQEKGNLQIGLGVQVDSITQVIDEFLAQQLRDTASDRASAELQNDANKALEQLLGELSTTDLSSSLTGFFGAIEDTLNATAGDALSVRNLAVLEGKQLASEMQRIESEAKQLRDSYDERIVNAADTINALTEEIRKLNIRITQVEGGSSGGSDAGALRAARQQAVNQLTELVSATVDEQPSGGLSIAVNGEFLVFEGQRRDVVAQNGSEGEAATQLAFADTLKALQPTGGTVHGLSVARDEIVDGFRDSLNEFAATLIHEFNLVYSQGQGINGFSSLTSLTPVDSTTASLDQAGLPFAPQNGSFKITLQNDDGTPTTTEIRVRLTDDSFGDSDTLASVASQIDAISGLSASVDSNGLLTIETDSADSEFAFSDDTSGLLASIGLNTFFSGSSAEDIAINPELDGIRNAGKLALGLAADGEPATPTSSLENAIALASLIDEPLESLGGASITERYDQVVNELAQNSTVAGSVLDGLEVFESTLEAEFQAVSGVSVDEEALEMIALQRIYQATGRVIQTIQAMLDTLVNL